jgi:hypothetical protein
MSQTLRSSKWEKRKNSNGWGILIKTQKKSVAKGRKTLAVLSSSLYHGGHLFVSKWPCR